MAVDFAAKRRDRDGAGWGLRNFKLRMSRKLIFAAGLAACLSCKLRPPASSPPEAETEEDYATIIAERLLSFCRRYSRSKPWLGLRLSSAHGRT